ncbi:MAG: vacuolar family H+-ATPase subunit H [Lachnospiraceae bacterium]|nr:vacuolar family H+-ATPase subunit H [Lachnospiraceae bacterium]
MANKIEQVIADIEEYIDGCKMQAFSNTKIIVDRPQIEQFLDELREYTPEEVKKYQRMLNNRDKILNDANKQAKEIEEKSQAYAEHLVSENSITKMAYSRADDILKEANSQAEAIVESANADAKIIREGAMAYANDMLSTLQSILNGSIEDISRNFTDLLNTLSDHRNIVTANQKELNEANGQEEAEDDKNGQSFFETDGDDDEDYNVDFEDD